MSEEDSDESDEKPLKRGGQNKTSSSKTPAKKRFKRVKAALSDDDRRSNSDSDGADEKQKQHSQIADGDSSEDQDRTSKAAVSSPLDSKSDPKKSLSADSAPLTLKVMLQCLR